MYIIHWVRLPVDEHVGQILPEKTMVVMVVEFLIYVVYHFGGRALRARIVVYNVYQLNLVKRSYCIF